jgi:hypothetical protein
MILHASCYAKRKGNKKTDILSLSSSESDLIWANKQCLLPISSQVLLNISEFIGHAIVQ